MSQVLQVRCPKCQMVLRVPAEWLGQAVRCKHCQQIFQGVAGPPATAPAAAPKVAAPKVAAPKVAQTPKPGPAPKAAPARAGAAVAAGRKPVPSAQSARSPAAHTRRPRMKPLPAALLMTALCAGITCAGHFSWVLLRGPDSAPTDSAAAVPVSTAGTPVQIAHADIPGNKSTPRPGEKTVNTIPSRKDPAPKPDDSTKNNPPPKAKDPAKKPRDQDPPAAKVDPPRPKVEAKPDLQPSEISPSPKPKELVSIKDKPPAIKPEPPTTPDPPLPPPLRSDPNAVARPRSPDDPFPRRALLISVTDYLFCNPLSYGSPLSTGKAPFPGSSTQALAGLLTRPPFSIPDAQIAELSDGLPAADKSPRRPRDPVKQVLKETIEDFLNSSRPQDRIMIVFAGHTLDVEAECYLVPMDGSKDDVATLIPLSWVYERLAQCKAKQKLLVLDVCRYPLVRGLERSGAAEEMSDQLDTLLMNPPAGVQVWSSCTRGQKSLELARGGVFLESLCAALGKEFARDASLQTEPLPLGLIVPEVNRRMKERLDPLKADQVSRVSGFEANNKSTYDPDEKQPVRLAIPLPKFDGPDLAGMGQVNDIVDEIKRIPMPRQGQSVPRLYPVFSAKLLGEFKADYPSWDVLEEMIARDPRKYALRKAVLEGIAAIKESDKMNVLSRLPNPKGGPLDANAKQGFLKFQQDPALKILALQQALEKLQAASESKEKDSKRWQAHYDLTIARMQSRLLFIYEYNYMLGSIRLDSLPDLEKGVHNGWRLVSREVPQVLAKEAKVKDLVKQLNRSWKRLASDYAGTPWAVIAVREQQNAAGLEWRASKD